MRTSHEIRTYFHDNFLKTRTICNLCEATYPIDTNLTNLKNYFFKHHTTEYYLAMNKNEEKRKEIQKTNTFQTNNNTLLVKNKNNETNIQPSKHVQIQDDTDYEIEETVENDKALLPIQPCKRTNNDVQNNQILEKQKKTENIINHIDNIELTKESQIKIIKDTISISGECKIFFK